MKRALFALLFFAVSLFAKDPWPGVPFTEVRAYAWPNSKGNEDKQTEPVILPDRSLLPGVLNPNGALLTAKEVEKLVTAVNGKHETHVIASCHIPHNAFVFYDPSKKPVAFVEICFGCLNHRIEPKGASEYPYLLALARIFISHKLPLGEYSTYAAFKEKYNSFK